MSATIIPFDIYDAAVVVDRFISLSTQLEQSIDAGLAAHNKAEADQGYLRLRRNMSINIPSSHDVAAGYSKAPAESATSA
jgi:hypothetical protein